MQRPPSFCRISVSILKIHVLETGNTCASNRSAGNLDPGISAGLSCKIVWHSMKNEGASDQLLGSKPIGEEDTQSIAVCPENRGKVTCMFRMKTVIWIEMAICIGKGIICIAGTLASRMDMEAKDRLSADPGRIGKSHKLSHCQGTSPGRIEAHLSMNVWILAAAPDLCPGLW